MTQREFLKAIGLTRDDFSDLMVKFSTFHKRLNPAQKDAVRRSMSTISQALDSLDGDMTAERLNSVVKRMHPGHMPDDDGGTFGKNILVRNPNGT